MPQKKKPTPPKRDSARGQVDPDGVIMDVDWGRMEVGMSVFIPAVNTPKLRIQCASIARSRGWKFTYRHWVEDNIVGLRVWRSL